MKRSAIIIMSILLLIGLIVVYLTMTDQDADQVSAYSTSMVSRGDVVVEVSATGTLNPMISVLVGSQVSGVIQHLYVDFNAPVKKGDLVARIEPSLFQAQVTQARANLQSALAGVEKADIVIVDARRVLGRKARLFEQNASSESEVDAARLALEAAVVDKKVKEATVAQARAALEQTQVNLAYTEIHAPIDGVVISRDVDIGQTVAASLQAPTLFSIAQDLAQMQIETEVDEAFIGQIQAGQPVSFTVFAYPDKVFAGKVVQVRLKPIIESGVVKYNCIIEVDNPDLALKPGMTATVAIEVARHTNTLKVSNQALRFVPQMDDAALLEIQRDLEKGEVVFWVPDGDTFSPVTVQRGLIGEKESEVSGADLKEGMVIAVPASGNDDRPRGRHGFRMF